MRFRYGWPFWSHSPCRPGSGNSYSFVPINIFDDQSGSGNPPQLSPAATTARRSSTSPPPPQRGSGSAVPIALLGALALIAGGYGVYRYQHDAPPPVAGASYIVKAETDRPKGECIDSSGSGGDHGALAKVALKTTAQIVSAWAPPGSVPDNVAVPAHQGLTLVARVVEADSFGTANAAVHTASVTIPAVAGLNAAAPLAEEPNYIDRSQTYSAQHSTVQRQLAAARSAVESGTSAIDRLVGQTSSGSDVTGCVLALAGILGPNSDILVASDLEDTRFTAPGAAHLAGSMKGVRLWIVQACPSGVPKACQKQLETFLGRFTPLGMSSNQVKSVRPEAASEAVHDWLGR